MDSRKIISGKITSLSQVLNLQVPYGMIYLTIIVK